MNEQRHRRARAAARLWSVALWAALTVAGTGMAVSEADEASTQPRILWFSISGLDTENNDLDRILADSGQLCDHNIFKRGRCPLELDFVNFLKRLPPSQTDISRKLQSLGAACRQADARLACTYEKHMRKQAIVGTELRADDDYFFKINLTIDKESSGLAYSADAERETTRIPIK